MNKKFQPTYFLIALIAVLAVWASLFAGLFGGLEHFFEDVFVSPKKVSPSIVIVTVDNDSISKIGLWPWSRRTFADALMALNQVHPKAVGIDVVFSEPSIRGSADDARLAGALRGVSYPVVLATEAQLISVQDGMVQNDSPLIQPLAQFSQSQPNVTLGGVNLILDGDGIVRSFPPSIPAPTSGLPGGSLGSFATTLAERAGAVPPDAPAFSSATPRIVYSALPGTIKHIPFWRLLSDPSVLQELKGKIVLIGATASDLHDSQLTPFSRGVAMPGVEIQANIVNMAISGYRLEPATQQVMMLLIFLAGMLSLLMFAIFAHVLKPLVANVILGLVYLIAAGIAFDYGIVVNLIHISLAWIIATMLLFGYRYFLGEKDRRQMRFAFSKYVSKDVLEEILQDPSKVKLGGEEEEVTIFFSDVRGFTGLSEKLTAPQLTHFLNKYLTRMTNIVLEEKGVVDKYIGDAIMSFWGAPIHNPHHPLYAIRASLRMVEALADFNAQSVREGDPEIQVGIGLNSGKVVVGNMGSDQRFDYTVMGDSVNLASRLESLTKAYGVSILISEFTVAMLLDEDRAREGIVLREIDTVKVKGKKMGVTLYEVVPKHLQQQVGRIAPLFSAALALYYAGKWQQCLGLIAEIRELYPTDGPMLVLAERCEEFLQDPPRDWQGIYEHTSK